MTVTVVERRIDWAIVATQQQEADPQPPVPVDRLVESLHPTQQAAVRQSLAPLTSHTWFSSENYRRVVKWCTAALVSSDSAKQSTAALQGMHFLIAAVVDCYHNDRALYAATQLPDNPAPRKFSEIPEQIQRRGVVYTRRDNPLVWSSDAPMEAVDRVADIVAGGMPDRFLLASYVLASYVKPAVYDPIIYAQYGNWVVKVAEWP